MVETTYGFKTKTINIKAIKGKLKFKLQQNNELGLSKWAIILAIQCRAHEDDITASNGMKLVKSTVFENAYITLKDRMTSDGKNNMLLSEYYMTELIDSAFFLSPTTSALIDWNDSFIEINKRIQADVVNKTVFEIIVYYIDNINPSIAPAFKFRDGTDLIGIRQRYFEIPLNTSENEYSLSSVPNIGLPEKAWVIGFSTRDNGFPLNGNETVPDSILKSTYITFIRGTNNVILDFPAFLQDYDTTLLKNINYLPMTPVQVQHMDWEASKIRLKDTSGISDDQVFQFYLIWVMAC